MKRKDEINITLVLGIPLVIGVLVYFGYARYERLLAVEELKEAKKAIKKPNYSEAMSHVQTVLHYNHRSWEAYWLWAKVEMQQHQDYLQAVDCLSQTIGYADSPTAAMYYLRGKCYYKMGAYTKALKDLRRATKMRGKADSLGYFLKAAEEEYKMRKQANDTILIK